MATSSAATRRVQWDMLGSVFGHLAASVIGLLLVEKLCMELLLPTWAPALEALEATVGRARLVASIAMLFSVVGFWGVGTLFALPALLRVERGKIQINHSLNIGALLRAMPLVVVNFLLGTATLIVALLTSLPEQAFEWRAQPGTGRLARDVVVWILVADVVFFYVHHWLHRNKTMYAMVHKLHHSWSAPVSLVAIYCHPLEHVVANMAPMIAGPLLCGSHVAAVAVYILLGLGQGAAVHSGYWICGDDGMHDEHHANFTVNFGITGLMDALYGSYRLPAGAKATTADKQL